ncbi:pi31 proteasome regulator [Niveomyces insectorum RCEF 264]|uniref:Pi31 proteasome regulator n=1 Tax=Niveomyces insectorum RCEF 264 TaxID=1081102 RepID=A0A167PVP7_9HYPO|nr:pi31 proteasome regulator [Niveomyces insectorum RCEF 264]
MAPGNNNNPLSPSALLKAMVAVLPARDDGSGDGSGSSEAPDNAAAAAAAAATTDDDDDATSSVSMVSGFSSASTAVGTAAQQATRSTADITTAYEALGLFVHAFMTQLAFQLVGLQEDQPLDRAGGEQQGNTAQEQEQAHDGQEALWRRGRLPRHWNANPVALSFVYTHPQSSLRFVLRVDRMGARAELRGLATDADQIQRMELSTPNTINTTLLPWQRPPVDASGDGGRDDTTAVDSLRPIFHNDARLMQLSNGFQVAIVQRLMPGLQHEGYQELASLPSPEEDNHRNDPDNRDIHEELERAARQGGVPGGARGGRGDRGAQPPINPYQPNPLLDPLVEPPRRTPIPAGDFPPPGFEDEYELNRPPRNPGRGSGPNGINPGASPFNIGHDDLNPPGLGPHDPLRPSFGSGRGGFGGMGGVGGFGGMHPTFDDPLFQGPHGGDGSGGNGTDYDLQVPPGARYDDPTGAHGDELSPRFGGGRPGGRLGGRGGRGGFGPGGFGDGSGFGGGFGGFGGGGII